jgi:hypothetical protein
MLCTGAGADACTPGPTGSPVRVWTGNGVGRGDRHSDAPQRRFSSQGGEILRRSTLARAVAGMAAATALIPAAPAGAIVGGTPDFDHPSVGLVRFTTAEGRFRCSGTLIAPKVVLTAGHCTEGPATNVVVSFSQKLLPDPLRTGDYTGYINGTAHPDPGWDGQLQFAKQHDQGVVVLDEAAPVTRPSCRRRTT